MKEFVVWERETVERGYVVKADSAEEAVKKFTDSKRKKYRHYETFVMSILESKISDVIKMEEREV